jgi:hypothetical protein
LTGREKFARAYAQYIGQKSNDDALKNQADERAKLKADALDYGEHWIRKDFSEIMSAFDALFRDEGYLIEGDKKPAKVAPAGGQPRRSRRSRLLAFTAEGGEDDG